MVQDIIQENVQIKDALKHSSSKLTQVILFSSFTLPPFLIIFNSLIVEVHNFSRGEVQHLSLYHETTSNACWVLTMLHI